MMVTGPSGSGKTEWTRKLLLSSLVQPPPERILWCFGQWQPLYEDLQKRIPCIEFIRGIPDYLDNAQFMDPSKRNLIIFDDLRRFQNPIRQENVDQFKAKVNAYEERGFSSDKAIHLAANDDLPSLRKKLRRDYAQFLIDYYELQEDPVQQRILESAKTFKNQHDMNQADSIRQAIKLRKDLFMDVWPNHNIETEKASEDQEDSTTS